MAGSFDWRSEEGENYWVPEPPKPPPKKSWGRWPLLLAVSAICLSAAAFLIYRQVEERIAEAETAVREDVLAAHTFMLNAANSGDSDLFRIGLSGRDPQWSNSQTNLMHRDRLWDRAPMGIDLIRSESAGEPSVTISNDLLTAVITYTMPYQVRHQDVTLVHTAVYRRGDNRWLYAPPDDEFWGRPVNNQGALLTLIYPDRDAALLERVAFDLDRLLRKLCVTSPGLDCPRNMHIQVEFSTQPESLLQQFDLDQVTRSGRQITLPTPTLLGLPLDETGYSALLQGYATHIAMAVAADLTDYNCCRGGLFFRALLDWQLTLAGVPAWPLTPADYDALLQGDISRNMPNLGWQNQDLSARSENRTAVYAFVHYLLQVKRQDPAELQRQVNGRLMTWLREAGIDMQEQYADWVKFIYANSTFGRQDTTALPQPESNLNMLCRGYFESGQILYRYDFSTETWRSLITFPSRTDSIGINSVDYPDTFFITEYNYQAATRYATSYLWRQGERIPLNNLQEEVSNATDIFFTSSLMALDPQQRYLALSYTSSRPLSNQMETEVRLVDLQTCSAAGCQTSPIIGSPIWSPNGEWMLMVQQESFAEAGWPFFPLYLAKGAGENPVQVGNGWPATWLDEHSYGFLSWPLAAQDLYNRGISEMSAEMLPSWEVGTVGETAIQPLVKVADLISLIPSDLENPPELLIPFFLIANPGIKGEFILVSIDLNSDIGDLYLFSLSWFESVPPQMAFVTRIHGFDMLPAFSPDGRYLQYSSAATRTISSDSRREVILLNMETGERLSYFQSMQSSDSPGWSQEGTWLIQNQTNYSLLFAPDFGFHRLIMTDLGNCNSPFWSIK